MEELDVEDAMEEADDHLDHPISSDVEGGALSVPGREMRVVCERARERV